MAATVGSAVGLGNVWRFPNEVHANGGATFLIVYIGCILLLGIPVMLAEFSLGRGTASDSVGAFRQLAPGRPWWLAGGVALLASYMILCFYMVVAAWTLEYLWTSATGQLYDGLEAAGQAGCDGFFADKLSTYIASAWSPIVWIALVLIINMVVLIRGVQRGIERMSNLLMPVLFVILLVLCGVSLSLPSAGQSVEFFLRPDFSSLSPSLIVNALGQAFFSLSLGMGILITYSSYFPSTDNLKATAFSVAGCDFLVAFMMGLIIFPAVMSFGLADKSLDGAALVFVTLPEVFSRMPGTAVWSTVFFLLLFIAALTSTISIAEVSTLFVQQRLGLSRKKAVSLVILPLFVLSPVCSLSQGAWSSFTIAGLTIFDFLDTVATNYMLPTAAFFTCLFVGWKLPARFLNDQLTNHGTRVERLYPAVRFLIRYVSPLLILMVFISQLL